MKAQEHRQAWHSGAVCGFACVVSAVWWGQTSEHSDLGKKGPGRSMTRSTEDFPRKRIERGGGGGIVGASVRTLPPTPPATWTQGLRPIGWRAPVVAQPWRVVT